MYRKREETRNIYKPRMLLEELNLYQYGRMKMIRQTGTLWTTNRVVALILGILFTLLGIIGFFTPPENSTGVQALLGLFDVDLVHNLFFLITGVLGIVAAFTGYSRTFNQVFGIVYILFGLLGLIPALYFPSGAYGHDSGLFLGLTHDNAGDHVLHLVTGIVALVVGFFLTESGRISSRATPL